MKHLIKTAFVLALVLCSSAQLAFAQQMPPIPVDPNVRIGKLENGLTYYIRKNNLPENRADFYLAMKVGAILEEPDQRGLAHFLEHMSFNGTKHFPGDQLKKYLETIGVRFGYNLNAGTGIDETIYRITEVPVARKSVVDSCLLILHDWSNDLLLDEKEIDKERGVVNEEWRTTSDAIERMQQQLLPQLYAGTKYEDCLPIGNMEVINNFKPQALRDYYEKWYRPDLQGVVVVGDIDVDAVENKIKELFAGIPAQPDAPERIYYPVDDNQEPIVAYALDKEQPGIQFIIFNKHEAVSHEQKLNVDYLVIQYAKHMIAAMLNARLDELTLSAEPPFISAGAYDGEFFAAKTKDAFTGIANCKEEAIETGFAALYREIERARRFGFTDSEYLRARSEYLRNLESEYNERDKKKNDSYASQYVNHYVDNTPIPGIESEYALMNQLAPNLPVMLINQVFPSLVTAHNKVITVLGPEKEGLVYPTKERILEIMKEVDAEQLTAYEDNVSDEPLITNKPLPGTIVHQTTDDLFGTINLTLSNGAKVIIKQTDFKADEIRMKAVSMGGASLFPESEIVNILALNDVAGVGGMGNFSLVELEKALAGKRASVKASVGNKIEVVNGSCSPKDFETMMQLTYLAFTSPRKDMEAFSSYKNRTKATLQNQELSPMITFIDSINSTLYMNHPRAQRMNSSMVDLIDYDKILAMYHDRFMDASDFTFIFVGNVDMEAVKPFIEEYIASLPATNRKETFADNNLRLRKNTYTNEFVREQENPKASVFACYNGACKYTAENLIKIEMVSQILDLVYTESIREEEGGTYSVGVGGSLDKHPEEIFTFQIMFDTDPARKDKLMEIVYAEVQKLAKEGPSEENLGKVKEHLLKSHSEELKENGYWLSIIDDYLYAGINVAANFENIVNSITQADIQQFAAQLFGQNNLSEIFMISPEKK